MGGLIRKIFGVPDAPPPPAPVQSPVTQEMVDPREAQLDVQEKQIEAQEERLAQEKAEEARKLQATKRARARAGSRMLLSSERENPELGVGTDVSA
jgi:hypothetical protein